MNKPINNRLLTIITAVVVAIAGVMVVIYYSITSGQEPIELATNPNNITNNNEMDYDGDDSLTADDMLGGTFNQYPDRGEMVGKEELWYSLKEADGSEIDGEGTKSSSSVNRQYGSLISSINAKSDELKGNSGHSGNSNDDLNDALNDALNGVNVEKPSTPQLGNNGNNGNTSNNGNNSNSGTSDDNTNQEEPNSGNGSGISGSVSVEATDGNGVTTSSSNGKFNIYNYVDKDTRVLSGTSVENKVFKELDALNKKFVVVVNNTSELKSIIDSITNEYENKLLIDSLNYGQVSKESSNHFLFEINYLLTDSQMEELQKYASSVSDTIKDYKGKKKIEHISKLITQLGNYSESGANIYSPYSLYKDGYGVCQAYTSLAKILLDTIGIENGIATGSIDGVPHTWNIAKYDGEWYHFDFTLTDTKSNSSKYLFIKESNITSDRIVDNIIK